MTLVAVLLPFLVGSATVQATDTAGAPRVAYRARVALDEAARVLHGVIEVRYTPAAADSGRMLLLDVGSTPVGELRVEGATVVRADPASSRVLELVGSATHGAPLVFTVTVAARAVDAPGPARTSPRAFSFRAWAPRVLAVRPWPHPLPADYFVALDVPDDQVMGATGTPVCGDPGWSAARNPQGARVMLAGTHDSATARAAAPGRGDCASTGPGRKRVAWYAAGVPDFAVVLDPSFRYEEGDIYERPVHALYREGAERAWGAGVAVGHAESAVAWLFEVLEEPAGHVHPWPQTTLVQALDGDGSADPMLLSLPTPDVGAVVEQLTRMYAAGSVSVATADVAWGARGRPRHPRAPNHETQGRRGGYQRLERALLDDELDGRARPAVPRPGDAQGSGDAGRGEFLFYQLRGALGDSVTRAVLSAYWRRAALGTGDEALFRTMADSVSGRDLGPLLEHWLRDTRLTDYAIGSVRRIRPDSRPWRTIVVVKNPPGPHLPVPVQVVADSEVVFALGGASASRDTVVIETASEPYKVVLDPYVRTHDWNVLNGQRSFGVPVGRRAVSDSYVDTWFTRRTRRDRLTVGWSPTAWYNDAAGWTIGARRRTNYLDRFDLDELWFDVGTGAGTSGARHDVDGRFVLRNPMWLRSPGLTEQLDLGRIEGRAFAGAGVELTRSHAALGLSIDWLRTTAQAYLDTTRWDDAATLEVTAGARFWTGGRSRFAARVRLRSGHFTLQAPTAFPARGEYLLASAEATALRDVAGMHLRARLWGGAVLGSDALPRQRRIHVAGGDPYDEFANPFLRSRGAPLTRTALPYLTPGLGGLRAYDPALTSLHAAGASAEVEKDLDHGDRPLVSRLAVALFVDAGAADGDVNATEPGRLSFVVDAGLGIRADHHIGRTSFQTRFDFPLWVSARSLARRGQARGERLAYRWSFSFAPAF